MTAQKRVTPDSGNMLLGSGQLFFNRKINGVYQGERHLGHADSVTLATTVEKIEKYNKMVAARQKYASIVRQMSGTIKMSLNEFTPENIALALNGSNSVLEQKFAVVVDEAYTAQQGCYINTGKLHISGVSVKPNAAITLAIGAAAAVGTITSDGTVTAAGTFTGANLAEYYFQIAAANTAAGNVAGAKFIWKKGLYGAWSDPIEITGTAQNIAEGITMAFALDVDENFVVGDQWQVVATPAYTTYAPTTDYLVDEKTGRILIVAGGGIADGSTVKVSYTAAAVTSPKVAAATDANIEGLLRFVGDPASGPAYHLEAWKVNMTADGDIPLIGDDFAAFNVTAECLSDATAHPDDPYYRLVEI